MPEGEFPVSRRRDHSSRSVSPQRFIAFKTVMLAHASRIAAYASNRMAYIREISKLLIASPFFEEVQLEEDLELNQLAEKEGQSIYLNPKIRHFQFSEIFQKEIDQLASESSKLKEVNQWLSTLLEAVKSKYEEIQANKIDVRSRLYWEEHLEKWTKAQVDHINFEKMELDRTGDQSRQADHLVSVAINLRSFAAKNDYFNHEVGNQVIENMGELLIQLRKEIHMKYKIPWEHIAVHRASSINFVLSLRIKDENYSQALVDEIGQKLKSKVDHFPFLVDWNWSTLDIDKLTDDSIEAAVQSLMNNEGKVNLQDVPHHKSEDIAVHNSRPQRLSHPNAIEGIQVNLGYYHYNPNDLIQPRKDVVKFLDKTISQLNLENPNHFYDAKKEYFDQMKKNDPEGFKAFREKSRQEGLFEKREIEDEIHLVEYLKTRRTVLPSKSLSDLAEKIFNDSDPDHIDMYWKEYFEGLIANSEVQVTTFHPAQFKNRYDPEGNLYQLEKSIYFVNGNTLAFPVWKGAEIYRYIVIEGSSNWKLSELRNFINTSKYFDIIIEDFENHALLDFDLRILNHLAAVNELNQRKEKGVPFGMSMFDYNKFSGFDQTFGNFVGDQVIKVSARVIKEILKKYPVGDHLKFFRFGGGEEFLLTADYEEVLIKALQEIDQALANLFQDPPPDLLCSIAWTEIENNLKLLAVKKDLPIDLSICQQSYIEEVLRSNPGFKRKEVMANLNKPYVINPLRVKRFVQKNIKQNKGFVEGLSKSSGVMKVFPEDYGSIESMVDVVDAMANMAKSISNQEGGVRSVIYSSQGQIQ